MRIQNEGRDIGFLVLAMVLYGSIGIFRRSIGLSSAAIAFFRGAIGAAVLLLFMLLTRKRFSRAELKGRLPLLCISGTLIGANWIFLFEAYNYTSVAVATLCYYMAPLFVVAASPIILSEKLSLKNMLCVLVAVIGMVLVSGLTKPGGIRAEELPGILFGLAAAALYASVIFLNKKTSGVPAYERTVIQLASSSVILLPYCLLSGSFSGAEADALSVILLIILGVFHTGIAYALYFSALTGLKAQTAALFSYIDPIVAIILSAVIFREKLDAAGAVGALLVLGAAIVSELPLALWLRRGNKE